VRRQLGGELGFEAIERELGLEQAARGLAHG
jgi:hypothetical protein